jgi:hypothetical protein
VRDHKGSKIRGFYFKHSVPDLESFFNWSVSDPEIVALHFLMNRHDLLNEYSDKISTSSLKRFLTWLSHGKPVSVPNIENQELGQ